MKNDLENLRARLNHSFDRNEKICNSLSADHKGKETTVYNYYAGEQLGWYAGYAASLDLVLEQLDIIMEDCDEG